MPTASLVVSQQFLGWAMQKAVLENDLYLAIILDGNEVATDASYEAIALAEYGPVGWSRLGVEAPTYGAWNIDTGQWESTDILWTISSTTNLSIKQVFVVAGGSSSPGSTLGTLLGLATFITPIFVEGGVPKIFDFFAAVAAI
jgi:hypothetical protein